MALQLTCKNKQPAAELIQWDMQSIVSPLVITPPDCCRRMGGGALEWQLALWPAGLLAPNNNPRVPRAAKSGSGA